MPHATARLAPFGTLRFLDSDTRRRATSGGLALAVHIGVLLLALLAYQSRTIPAPSPAITTFEVDRPGPPEQSEPKPPQPVVVPPQPPQPVVVPPPEIVLPTENLLIPASLDFSQSQSAGGGCNLAADVQRALRANPEVMANLPRIPETRRSVANVLGIWKDTWTAADETFPEVALAAIRGTVADTVSRSAPGCRAMEIGGPRLIYLPANGETTVLAIGSGRWTWESVARSALADEEPATFDFPLTLADARAIRIRMPARLHGLGEALATPFAQ